MHKNALLLLLSRFSRVRLCATRRQPTRLPHPWDSPGRILEWVAFSSSNAWKWKVKVKSLSHVQVLATPWTAAYQAPPSMGFSRQEYWSGVPLPSPNNNTGLNKIVFHKYWKEKGSRNGGRGERMQQQNNKHLLSAYYFPDTVLMLYRY